ncbi:hypothetical protein C5U62_32205 [Pseudomonas protegens]|uniref:Uncharacterized protein n=1 Tax=Pseudomonas protegens TaxID=380021 RepID=A0A2T6GB53_9PSED|nr:hypothetical protein [Pseudomonas protegens]PUA41388.1 hypothetical protein C5U62_32205 [Pseudomonas protegens]
MVIDDLMTDAITLHGLGFIQIQLEANQRLHVWHPELPRRRCFAHSAIHNHRFSFISRVMVGQQHNHDYLACPDPEGDYTLYLHEGPRTAGGNRPWVKDGRCHLIHAGQSYAYHRTEPGGNGRVATLLTKTEAFSLGAHSSCRAGVEPDSAFDRYQWPAARLWEVVADVLGHGAVAGGRS